MLSETEYRESIVITLFVKRALQMNGRLMKCRPFMATTNINMWMENDLSRKKFKFFRKYLVF